VPSLPATQAPLLRLKAAALPGLGHPVDLRRLLRRPARRLIHLFQTKTRLPLLVVHLLFFLPDVEQIAHATQSEISGQLCHRPTREEASCLYNDSPEKIINWSSSSFFSPPGLDHPAGLQGMQFESIRL